MVGGVLLQNKDQGVDRLFAFFLRVSNRITNYLFNTIILYGFIKKVPASKETIGQSDPVNTDPRIIIITTVNNNIP